MRSIGAENGPVRAASGSKVAISPCQEPESGMSGDIDRGSNPRVEGRRGFRWRVETALAPAAFSCSRVREERGDGVKHSTTPDGQGVTTRFDQKTNPPSSIGRVSRGCCSIAIPHVGRNHERLLHAIALVDHRVGVDPVLRASNTPSCLPGNPFCARVVGAYPLDTPR